MPSKKLSLYFVLFSVMALGSLVEFRFPRIRLPRLGLQAGSTVVVERIPLREAQKLGVSYGN
jgi:hypothetical protein